jgi:protocatechuate 3,4-dioxygenase, alpha subunit
MSGRGVSELGETPSQTLGPFFHQGLPAHTRLWRPGVSGERIQVSGTVFDGQGTVSDALLELWQADAQGHYAQSQHAEAPSQHAEHFHGFGRAATDAQGRYAFDTIKPGHVTGPGGVVQARHLNLIVLARGLLVHLFTRLYFPGETQLELDPILSLVEPARRATLIARRGNARDGVAQYEFDVHLQGADETVFFDV